jgi:hypothetical protein
VKRARTGERAFETDLEEIRGTAFELKLSMEVGEKGEGIELNEDVVADVAVNGEACSGSEEFGASAKLKGVGSDGEIGLAAKARVVAGREIDGYAVELWEGRRGIESRMETPDGESEVGRALPLEAESHVTSEDELFE